MRKLALSAAALLVGTLGVTAYASAVQGTQTIAVKLQNSRAGTNQRPRSVRRLTVTTTTTPVSGRPPLATRRVVIHFDRNLVFGASKFAGCSQAQVQADDSRCPAGSRVGRGSARGSVFRRTTPTAKVAPAVAAYNGPRGTKIYLLLTEPTFGVRSVLVGTLKPDTGNYGRKLDVAIPASLRAPLPGLVVTLTRLVASVGGTRSGTPYVGLRGCAGGTLRFKGDFFYTDGSRQSAASTATCRRS